MLRILFTWSGADDLSRRFSRVEQFNLENNLITI